MPDITINLDLFCHICGSPLIVSASKGSFAKIKPCSTCIDQVREKEKNRVTSEMRQERRIEDAIRKEKEGEKELDGTIPNEISKGGDINES